MIKIQYLNDVWVNWFQNCNKGYDVCNFHEWRREDNIQLVDHAPLIKIDHPLFYYIENTMSAIPNGLLNDVKMKSFIREKGRQKYIDYCFVATDGDKFLVVDTVGSIYPTKKSRLMPRQEKIAFDIVNNDEVRQYEFIYNDEDEGLSDDCMRGLTRRERIYKKILYKGIVIKFENSNDIQMLKYYYTEWNPYGSKTIHKLKYRELLDLMIDEMKSGWNRQHEELLEIIIRGNSWLEDEYLKEKNYKKLKK